MATHKMAVNTVNRCES